MSLGMFLRPPISGAMKRRFVAGLALAVAAGAASPTIAADSVCARIVSITASAEEPLSVHITEAAARDAAVRAALAEAAMRGGGVDIANSFRLVERATADTVAFETDQRTLMRSRTRVLSWVLDNVAVETDATGRSFATVTITAEVCQDASAPLPLIVAFGDFAPDPRVDTAAWRGLMLDLFPSSPHYEVTLNLPSLSYYDIVVAGDVLVADAFPFDRTREIATLRQFLGDAGVAALSPEVQRIRAVVQVYAETILGAGIVAVEERVRDIAVGADPTTALYELAGEALLAATGALFERLTETTLPL